VRKRWGKEDSLCKLGNICVVRIYRCVQEKKKKEKRDKIRWELEGVYNVVYDYCSQDDNSSRAQKNVSNIKYIFLETKENMFI